MRQFELEAKVWVARDDGRLMTLLPTFQPDLGHRQCQAKIRVPRTSLRVGGPHKPSKVRPIRQPSIVLGVVTSTLWLGFVAIQ